MMTCSKKDFFSYVRPTLYFLVVAAIAMGTTLCAKQAAASSVYLKNSTTITDGIIRLGDIFGGLEGDEEKVVGTAPLPGKNLVIDSQTLLRLAVAMDLSWRPEGSGDRVVLRRAATVIDEASLKKMIMENISKEKSISGRFDVLLSTTGNDIILPHDLPPSAEITNLDYSIKNNWFQATIEAPSSKNPVKRLTLTGSVKKIVEVPVIKSNMRSGDVINMSDIEWIDMYEQNLQHDYLINAENLVGMTPRRMIIAQKPIRRNELEAPKLVSRGDKVTIMFENGPLILTAEGKAIRDGAKGDYIKVVNNASNRTIEGIVTGNRVVTVR